VGGAELALDRVSTEIFDCLPTVYEEFATIFLDGLNMKNTLLFQRRIQGLVSYFKGADDRMLPRRVDDEKMLEKIAMSEAMFNNYLAMRKIEISMAKKEANPSRADDGEMKMYRVLSRLACDFAIPPELRKSEVDEAVNEDNPPDKTEIL
jgi:hypothetical protein